MEVSATCVLETYFTRIVFFFLFAVFYPRTEPLFHFPLLEVSEFNVNSCLKWHLELLSLIMSFFLNVHSLEGSHAVQVHLSNVF